MKKIFTLLFLFTTLHLFGQHTFSIVAVDSVTGEVGGAGASCIDANNCCAGGAAIINDVHPGVGVVHCQAYLNTANRTYAKNLMNKGYLPCQIIDSLVAFDAQGNPQIRQYGIAGLYAGKPKTCAFTGTGATNYKNHIVGKYYSIQGNTLLGQRVLDSMQARFLRAPGDLACKLMAALQGAKMIGADTRCAPSGNSSLSAFVRVAKPGDNVNNIYMNIVVDKGPSGFEPIDSLQKRFNLVHTCGTTGMGENSSGLFTVDVFPNPFTASATIKINTSSPAKKYKFELYDCLGSLVKSEWMTSTELLIKKGALVNGVYFYRITQEDLPAKTGKLVIE